MNDGAAVGRKSGVRSTHANSVMNFNVPRTHPSRDTHKLNGHVGLELGGGRLGLEMSTLELSAYG